MSCYLNRSVISWFPLTTLTIIVAPNFFYKYKSHSLSTHVISVLPWNKKHEVCRSFRLTLYGCILRSVDELCPKAQNQAENQLPW